MVRSKESLDIHRKCLGNAVEPHGQGERVATSKYPCSTKSLDILLRMSIRRKMLRVLREQDYKKYEWLLEKLNLLYKPMPHDAPDGVMIPRENVERRVVLTLVLVLKTVISYSQASIERLTDLWCEELRRHRLKAYQRQLVREQPGFLAKKVRKLRMILQEERELGLEQTVTAEEIEECLKKSEEIQAKLDSEEYIEDEEYLIYKEETKPTDHTY